MITNHAAAHYALHSRDAQAAEADHLIRRYEAKQASKRRAQRAERLRATMAWVLGDHW